MARTKPLAGLTRKAAAEALGITPQALALWAKEPWFPAEAITGTARQKRYDVAAIRAARDQVGAKGSDHSSHAIKVRLARELEKLEQDRLQTARIRREEAEAAGDALPREELTISLREILVCTRDRITALPKELQRNLPVKQRKKFREAALAQCERILHLLADDLHRLAGTPVTE